MRYSSLLAILMMFAAQSAHAFRVNNEGLGTDHGFIKWEQLSQFPKQIHALEQKQSSLENELQTLRTANIVGAVLVAGALIYVKLCSTCGEQEVESGSESEQ